MKRSVAERGDAMGELEPHAAAVLAALAEQIGEPRAARTQAKGLRRTPACMTSRLRALFWLAARLSGQPLGALPTCPVAPVLRKLKQQAPELHANVPSVKLRAAPGAVHLVLSNLIRNAQQHARSSPIYVQGAIQSKRPSPCFFLLTLADEGPGIPHRVWPHLFEPFAKGTRGHGMGLWLARQMACAHGGDLWLNETRRGASFSLLWPIADAKPQCAAKSR